ncbi:MAG: hypothetical protein MHPSP_001516, partial [Paramarteilia canceri]
LISAEKILNKSEGEDDNLTENLSSDPTFFEDTDDEYVIKDAIAKKFFPSIKETLLSTRTHKFNVLPPDMLDYPVEIYNEQDLSKLWID